jgi:hypothetical protein
MFVGKADSQALQNVSAADKKLEYERNYKEIVSLTSKKLGCT